MDKEETTVTERLIAHLEGFGRIKYVGPGADGTLLTLSEDKTGINVTVEILSTDEDEDER